MNLHAYSDIAENASIAEKIKFAIQNRLKLQVQLKTECMFDSILFHPYGLTLDWSKEFSLFGLVERHPVIHRVNFVMWQPLDSISTIELLEINFKLVDNPDLLFKFYRNQDSVL